MRLATTLVILIVTIMSRVEAAPINNSTQVQEVQTVTSVENETDASKQAQQDKPKTEKKTERPKPKQKAKAIHPKGCENYRQLVSKYDWNVEVALQVMRAESGCNPYAVGDKHLTYYQNGIEYGMSCGMFQVRFLPGRPTCSQMQNPEKNIAYAYGLYQARGWQPWTVCNKGIVSCY